MANYDYLYGITDDFRVGGGAHLGLSKFQNKGSNNSGDSWKLSDTGFAYGVQLAAIYDITKNVEFELSLSHTRHTAKLKVDDETDKLKYATSGYAAINFKF